MKCEHRWRDCRTEKPPMGSFVPGQGWVPVEKVYVLAVDAKGRQSVGYARAYANPSNGYRWTFAKPIGEPTHWMPLPEVPCPHEYYSGILNGPCGQSVGIAICGQGKDAAIHHG